jgi:peptidoglycan/LPS O-acetylase OafA/YrhL
MRLQNLQALRGVACLMVVAYHAATVWRPAEIGTSRLAPFLHFGFGGVDLFFALSGFVITWVNFDALGDRSRLAGYVARRLWRIYPVFWACCFLAGPLVCSFGYSLVWLRLTDVGLLTRRLLLIPTTGTDFVIPQAWSLMFEVLFYLIFALFLLLPRRAFVPCLWLWLVGIMAGCAAPTVIEAAAVTTGPIARWWLHPCVAEFVLGCLVAVAARRGCTRAGPASLGAGVAGFAVAGVAVWLFGWSDHAIRFAGYPPLFGVQSALIVYGSVAVERSRRWVFPRWLQAVGDASYPIYLIHLAVFTCARRNFAAAGRGPTRDLFVVGLATLAAVAAGFVIHYAFERPLMNVVHRRRTAAPPLNASALSPLRRAA